MSREASANGTPTECSRAGCRAPASWRVNWRNPRIHPVERVKVWVACDEHVEFLNDYLQSRGFPVVVTTIGDSVERIPDAAS